MFKTLLMDPNELHEALYAQNQKMDSVPKSFHSYCMSWTPFFLKFTALPLLWIIKKPQPNNKKRRNRFIMYHEVITPSSEYYSPNMHPSIYIVKKYRSVKAFLKYQPDCASLVAHFTTHFLLFPRETKLHVHQTMNLVLLHEHTHCLSKWWAHCLPQKSMKVADGSATSKTKEPQVVRTKFCLLYFLWPLFQRIHCTPQVACLGILVHTRALQTASLNYVALPKLQC